MTYFKANQTEALVTLLKLFPKEKMVIIGASAISCYFEMKRTTLDIDLSIALALNDYAQKLEPLKGWSNDPANECRWYAPGKVQLDIIPADPHVLSKGYIIWPKSGRKMSLLGLRLAFETAKEIKANKKQKINIASLSALAVLKIVSYVDRPTDREKDLGDLAYIMDNYLDDDRRFFDEILQLDLEYSDVSPFQLGRDLSKIINEKEEKVIHEFLSMTRNEQDPAATLTRMSKMGPADFRGQALLSRRLEAFEKGVQSSTR